MDNLNSPFSQESATQCSSVLSSLSNRIPCSKCNKKIKYYCYYCCEVVDELKGKIPSVPLPFMIDIYRHARELEGKSTSVHAKLLSPSHVNIITYDPESKEEFYMPTEGEYVLYPSEDSIDISKDPLPFPMKKLIVLDGTWSQSKGMAKRFAQFPKVSFSPQASFFWRYQNIGPHCLSTIEAIYHFACQYSAFQLKIQANGQFDGLLFFFVHFYHLIQERYNSCEEGKLKFHSGHRSDYIKSKRVNGTD